MWSDVLTCFFLRFFDQVFAWGSNATGQLGLNAVSAEPIVQIPKIVKSLATKHVVQIACGQNHSLALTNGNQSVENRSQSRFISNRKPILLHQGQRTN